MRFKLVDWINPGPCPECKGWSRRMWLCVEAGRSRVVCCEACCPEDPEPQASRKAPNGRTT